MDADPLGILDDEVEALDEQVPPGRGEEIRRLADEVLQFPEPERKPGTWTHEQTREMGRRGAAAKAATYDRGVQLLKELQLDPENLSFKMLAVQAASTGPGALSAHKLLRQIAGLDGPDRNEDGETFIIKTDQRSAGQLVAALRRPQEKVEALRLAGDQVVRVDHENGSLWVDAQGVTRAEAVL
jgi:hypothetical protein